MDRLFCVLMLCAMLTSAAAEHAVMDVQENNVRPVFFSMLFPQLIPQGWASVPQTEVMML